MNMPVISPNYASYLRDFEQTILRHHNIIEAWFRQQWQQHTTILRFSGYSQRRLQNGEY